MEPWNTGTVGPRLPLAAFPRLVAQTPKLRDFLFLIFLAWAGLFGIVCRRLLLFLSLGSFSSVLWSLVANLNSEIAQVEPLLLVCATLSRGGMALYKSKEAKLQNSKFRVARKDEIGERPFLATPEGGLPDP